MTAQFQLVMYAGPTPNKIFPLDGENITIGREAGNNIVINDAEVSRKHARFILQEGNVIVSDLGSTNGTFVDGQPLTGQLILQPGQIVSLGEQINLHFEAVATGDIETTLVGSGQHLPGPNPIDPNATMLTSERPLTGAAPLSPPSQPIPYSTPLEIGQIVSGPGETDAPPSSKAGRSRLVIIMVIILAMLCLLGSCIGVFWYLNATAVL